MRGTFFRKADLHIHTSASRDYSQKDADAYDIVAAAMSQELEVIAITDHNSVAQVQAVRDAANEVNAGITVFPGVEISTKNGHVLAVFDPSTPIRKLDELLTRVGIPEEKRGKEEALAGDIEEVLSEVAEAGGLAIAAHANTKKIGFLQVAPGQLKIRVVGRQGLAALEFTKYEDCRRFRDGDVPSYPSKATVQGSDAHRPEEIGRRFTYFKMDDLSLEGLRQALLDPAVRVRFSADSVAQTRPRILGMSVSQGFFAEQPFTFHPQLTCLVGGKGVGKSTVIELLRYAFDCPCESFDDISADYHSKVETLVGVGGRVTVDVEDENGLRYVLERQVTAGHEEQPVCRDADGEARAFPFIPRFFSQGELARIGGDRLAQLDLIDQYASVSEETDLEDTAISDLRENALKIVESEGKIARFHEALSDREHGKKATVERRSRLEKAIKLPIFTEFPKWSKEERYLTDVGKGLSNAGERFSDAINELELEELFPAELPATSPNHADLSPLREIASELTKQIEAAESAMEKRVEELQKKVEEAGRKWEPIFKTKKREYDKKRTAEGGDREKLVVELEEVEKRLSRLEKLERDKSTEEKRLKRLEEERTRLRKQLTHARDRRFRRRSEVAEGWTDAFPETIKATIHPLENRSAYLEALLEAVEGSYIQRKQLDDLTKAVGPSELVQLIRAGDQKTLLERGAKKEVAKRLLPWFQTRRRELLSLEEVALDDVPELSFAVEPGHFKPLHELSTGQKSTVLILIAIHDGAEPLVIDQPEDSLDASFIHKEVVQQLRRGKDGRQFIFATHNPTLLVGADADLSTILGATADTGHIQDQGGIDRQTTKDLLVVHLEGGKDAFETRRGKYGKL